jgi:hypothetical protein
MTDSELESLMNDARRGDVRAVEKLWSHIQDLRHLVGELAEGLECEELQSEVSRVLEPELWDKET